MTVEVERLVCCQAHANRSLKLNLFMVNIDYIIDDLDDWLPLASGGRLLTSVITIVFVFIVIVVELQVDKTERSWQVVYCMHQVLTDACTRASPTISKTRTYQSPIEKSIHLQIYLKSRSRWLVPP
jgi:hypothetical protein